MEYDSGNERLAELFTQDKKKTEKINKFFIQ